jgi:hypothetical protein
LLDLLFCLLLILSVFAPKIEENKKMPLPALHFSNLTNFFHAARR